MSLQSTVLQNVAKAFEVADDLMETYTFSSVDATYDPSNSETTRVATSTSVKGFIDTDSASYQGISAVTKFDIVVYVKGLTSSPQLGDTLVVGMNAYTIVYVMDIHAGDQNALHRIWLKK